MKANAIQLLSNAGIIGPVVIVPSILQEMGASLDQIGLVAGGFAAAGFFSSYFFGRRSDMHGRRVILLVGLLLSGFASALQALSVVVGGLALFAAVRLLIGLASGIFPAALLAYAYDTRGGKMGSISGFGALGWGLGNLVVGLFGLFYGPAYEEVYLACTFIIFGSFVIALRLPFTKETSMSVPLFPMALIRRNATVYASMLIRHTGANMIWVTYPLFLISIGASPLMVSVIYAVNAFGQFAFMAVMDRFEPAVLVAVGLASSAATFYTFTLVGSFWEIIPAQILLAASYSSLYVGCLRYVMDRNKEKATASGLLSSTMSVSGIIGPVLGGLAATAFDFKGTILIATLLSLVALGMFFYTLNRSGEFYRLRARFRSRI
jgi:MFS family permease